MVTKHRASQARNHCLPGASVETSVYWACTNRPRVCNSIGLLVCIIWCPCGSWWPAQNGPTLDLEPRSSSAALLALRPNQHPVKVLELTRSLITKSHQPKWNWWSTFDFRLKEIVQVSHVQPTIHLPKYCAAEQQIRKKTQNHSKKNVPWVPCHPGVLQFRYFVWSKWGALKGESTRSRMRSRVLNISFQRQNMTLRIATKTGLWILFSGPRNTSQIVTKGNEPIPASTHSVTGILWHAWMLWVPAVQISSTWQGCQPVSQVHSQVFSWRSTYSADFNLGKSTC